MSDTPKVSPDEWRAFIANPPQYEGIPMRTPQCTQCNGETTPDGLEPCGRCYGTRYDPETEEMRLLIGLLWENQEMGAHVSLRATAQNILVGADFGGWELVRKSALHTLCRQAGVDYDDFDPTDGQRAATEGT